MGDARHSFAFAPDVVLQVIDREALLLNLEDEVVFALNETGSRIAQLLVDGTTVEEAVDALSIDYEAARADLREDVTDLVNALVARGLVVVAHEGIAT